MSNPENQRNIYKYSTEQGHSWNGYSVRICKNGQSWMKGFPLSRFNGSWWKAGKAAIKWKKQICKEYNILYK